MANESALTLTSIARAGFQDLTASRPRISALAATLGVEPDALLTACSEAADPDEVLTRIEWLLELQPGVLDGLAQSELTRLALLFGSSPAIGGFFARHPQTLRDLLSTGGALVGTQEAMSALRAAVHADSADVLSAENGWGALRVRYRELLARVMLYDLEHGLAGEAADAFEAVAASLSDLAGAAVQASYEVARATLAAGLSGPTISAERLDAVRLAIVAMGKCGARELNVVSDVDVLFVADSADDEVLGTDALIRVATRLAAETMRGIHDPAQEPPLWQLDANLRPEGRNGPLVRTLGSMLTYYDRWAKGWEFQALLKARPLAGDLELGAQFVASTRDAVWASASREDFVGSVQRMRRRVTEHIADDEVEVQLKLGPGGLRDIEFSAQLLQLVHGQYDDALHERGTLPALRALAAGGYIGRSDADSLASDYRTLRVLEHRLQMRELRRTALMPRDPEQLRVLARASRLARTADELCKRWEAIKHEVSKLHLKIFYAPLLSAVAALPDEELVLGSEAARARLHSIGFRDPDGAMRHLTALTRGTTRRAQIQRNLMPVLLQWLADGTDPDFGLLAFRRVSEANLNTPWYVRLLRDGGEAAERLTRVLACSRYAAELLESLPESVAWLEHDSSLQPVPLESLRTEMRSLASRRDSAAAAAEALRTLHRREILRLAMGRTVDIIDDRGVALGLDAAHTALLEALLMAVRQENDPSGTVELSIIGMGRYGGGELGFASDIDIIAVFRPAPGAPLDAATKTATRLISELRRLVADPRFPVDLDFDLRPEGKNGPLVRSLDAYRSYYEKWSATWEAQALLRARHVAGDAVLGADFERLADELRYPPEFPEERAREIRRIKARVETERLPHGGDPGRHLKLGPGGISDVEWLVQLLQLQSGHRIGGLRTVSTLSALSAAKEAGLLSVDDEFSLVEAWRFASRVRSAIKLWTARASDVLPTDWRDAEGVVELLDSSFALVNDLEETWLSVSRHARAVFERVFFGYDEPVRYSQSGFRV